MQAWTWLWTWMSESMTLQLQSAGSSSSLIQMAWEMTCDSYEDERGKVDGSQVRQTTSMLDARALCLLARC